MDLSCDRNSGLGPWRRINETGNFTINQADPNKYTEISNRLVIKNVVGADEGLYQCQDGGDFETAACVFVLG